jgi:hypothetical protein
MDVGVSNPTIATMGLSRSWGTRDRWGDSSVGAVAVGAAEAGVDGFAFGEGFVFVVPGGDAGFAELPAEEDDGAFELAGEGEAAFFEVGDLDADGFDLSEGVAGLLDGFFAFGAAAGGGYDVDAHAAGEEDGLGEGVHLGLEGGGGVGGGLGALEEALEEGQEGLGFGPGEDLGHGIGPAFPALAWCVALENRRAFVVVLFFILDVDGLDRMRGCCPVWGEAVS